MSKIMKCLAVFTIAMLFVLPGCFGGGSDIRIGTILPLTGDLSAYGPGMQEGVELAVKQINNAGGVLGKDIVLVSEDSETSGNAAVGAMNKLVNIDKVIAFIGAAGSGVSKAIIDIAIDNEVVQVSPSNTGTDFTSYNDNDFYYRTCPTDALQGKAMAKIAFQSYATASTISINNDYGVGFEEVFVNEFEALGGVVLDKVRYDPGAQTFDAEVTDVSSGNPDVIVLIGYPDTGSQILRKAYEMGVMDDSGWLLSEGLRDETLAESTGTDDDGNYIIAGMTGTTPDPRAAVTEYNKFIIDYQDEYNKEPVTFVPNSYDAMVLLALAIEKAGEAGGPAIKSAIRDVANAPGEEVSDVAKALELLREGKDINYQGVSGELTIDENGDVYGTYCVWQIGTDGSIELGDAIDIE